MGRAEQIAAKAEELLVPVTESFGVSVYDVEYVTENNEKYLRAYIDKEGGVTIDDCENVSRAFETKLDESGLIEEQYILEVSSPGLGRTLSKDRHLEKSIGQSVEISFYKQMVIRENETSSIKSKSIAGILKAFDKESITIEDTETEITSVWQRSDIAQIKLSLDF
ncbi:MAG: ribosome maturation factor RimP [Lachnospiraceae bacterium]|nr:ribosome maturation factor RimP [Lachnospiraceae bacterium]MBP3753672.1 ribosome maturation factor RimP [Lachnospiraceae bacterium]